MTALLGMAGGLSGRQPLNNPVAGKHTTIDREVAADHEGTHGGVLLGQRVGFVSEIRLILSSVDQDQTGVTAVVPVALVCGIPPSTSSAKTLKVLHVKASHIDGGSQWVD